MLYGIIPTIRLMASSEASSNIPFSPRLGRPAFKWKRFQGNKSGTLNKGLLGMIFSSLCWRQFNPKTYCRKWLTKWTIKSEVSVELSVLTTLQLFHFHPGRRGGKCRLETFRIRFPCFTPKSFNLSLKNLPKGRLWRFFAILMSEWSQKRNTKEAETEKKQGNPFFTASINFGSSLFVHEPGKFKICFSFLLDLVQAVFVLFQLSCIILQQQARLEHLIL